ncbi:MAG: hypothetical protein QY330_05225 [Candidatus Dojkabacteria bacterium]|uniref:Glycosyl hydrolase family 57 n=2 Tax=Candidatus Dojkabacteria TaxID=74243 RepID=A0A136KEV0_9BACT|nr:MAG: Glycosyl hydrolase family 57 [candidate division WS6 bacterium OLB21]MBW7953641.1 hypothetical protein [Candidatus Dojkabacteria bacterium]WKZ27914.1 MAG: hypothetical protein QY330_05225 [Candidatus Dojkabacteria bacterium]
MPKSQAKKVLIYFKVHQPYYLADYKFFQKRSFAKYDAYFKTLNKQNGFARRIIEENYYPLNELLLRLLSNNENLYLHFGFSGVTLEQFQKYDPELITGFKQMVSTGRVNVGASTYYHSRSWDYSRQEFVKQVIMQRNLIWDIFRVKANWFTDSVHHYSNELAKFLKGIGFDSYLTTSNLGESLIYENQDVQLDDETQEIMLKNRFSDKRSKRLHVFNLGRVGALDKVIFDQSLLDTFLSTTEVSDIGITFDYNYAAFDPSKRNRYFRFITDLLENDNFNINSISVTDKQHRNNQVTEHNVSSYNDLTKSNQLQLEAISELYKLEEYLSRIERKRKPLAVKRNVFEAWRRLQSFDHIEFMDTHNWESKQNESRIPYDSPYDAYINFMNIVQDFNEELKKIT